jgi:glucokinase
VKNNSSQRVLLGVDIGGTNLKALALSDDGQIVAEQTAPTNDDGSDNWRIGARDFILSLLNRFPADTPLGIAAPGLPDRDGLTIASMPERLKGLEGLNWQQWLGLKSPVPVLNDARAALLGETWLGAAKGLSNVILLTLGTGVGGAAMVDGRILHGHLGRAGHLGHTSLNPNGSKDIVNTPGSLEDAIGDHTLAQRSGGKFQSTRELVAAVRARDGEAERVWKGSVRALAAAIATFINLFDPEVVLLGGGIADAGEVLFAPLQAMLNEFEWRPNKSSVRLIKAALGFKAGAIGAAFAAANHAQFGVSPSPRLP